PMPAVAETPQPEPLAVPEPMVAEVSPPAVVDADAAPLEGAAAENEPGADAAAPRGGAAAEPEPAADAAPAEMTDAERAAARWRGRMKSKSVPKEDRAAEQEASEVQSAPEAAEDVPQGSPSANGSGSDPDVDVVALAREFSSLFGDEG